MCRRDLNVWRAGGERGNECLCLCLVSLLRLKGVVAKQSCEDTGVFELKYVFGVNLHALLCLPHIFLQMCSLIFSTRS